MKALLLRVYERFLFWKWDREYDAAVRRARGCPHARTMWVDVGAVYEKCCDCWALRMPAVMGYKFESDEMEWVPNSANPKKARRVNAPEGGRS